METTNKQENFDGTDKQFTGDIFSRVFRAGKRTYFFDVKSTKKDELYLTITESKRYFEDDGRPVYEKHKIFLYREDFEQFMENMDEIVNFILEKQPLDLEKENCQEVAEESYTNIEFEDLLK
ncbi:MAG: PUR family DNA/RNA-binding protein [Prolixibacteraceae bacterium]|nr:PUR family DNA/RNA-binding protein [Prolixibacteraceae bacterium]